MDSEVKVGTACNNNCIFCLNEERKTTLSTQQIKAEIDALSIAGVSKVNFTGGEVTIRPDYFEILGYAKRRGLDICIQTNGRVFYYAEFARKTARIGIGNFLISLHAHNEDLNRQLTNVPGGFEQTTQGIINLLQLGQSVAINIVASSKNIQSLPEIVIHHCRLNPTSIQISWARPMGKTKMSPDLMPRYSTNIKKIAQSIEIAKSAGKKLAVIGIPPCVLGEYIDHYGRPYNKSVLRDKGGIITAEDRFNKELKTLLEPCKECDYAEACGGVFKEYVKIYGTEEFAPIKKESDVIKTAERALGEEIVEFSPKKGGYVSQNFIATTAKNKYFVKESETTPDREKAEMALKEVMRANDILFLDPIKTVLNPPKRIEIYPFIDAEKKSPRKIRKEEVAALARTIGKLHKASGRMPLQENRLDELLLFAENSAFLDTNEKGTIRDIKRDIDKIKKGLKTAVIHNDLHLGNILWQQDKMIITDFEVACVFYTAWDAAKTIRSISYSIEEDMIVWNNIQQFIEEYSSWADRNELQALYPSIIFSTLDLLANLKKASQRIRQEIEPQTLLKLHNFLKRRKEFQEIVDATQKSKH